LRDELSSLCGNIVILYDNISWLLLSLLFNADKEKLVMILDNIVSNANTIICIAKKLRAQFSSTREEK